MLTHVRSQWRTENHRLREMEEVLNAPSQSQEGRRPVDSQHAQPRFSSSNRPAASPNRIGQRQRRRNRNPFPPVIVIGDDNDVEDDRRLNASSTTSVTRTRVDQTRITHHQRPQDQGGRAGTQGRGIRQQARTDVVACS
jgi:hypothetical protein